MSVSTGIGLRDFPRSRACDTIDKKNDHSPASLESSSLPQDNIHNCSTALFFAKSSPTAVVTNGRTNYLRTVSIVSLAPVLIIRLLFRIALVPAITAEYVRNPSSFGSNLNSMTTEYSVTYKRLLLLLHLPSLFAVILFTALYETTKLRRFSRDLSSPSDVCARVSILGEM